MAIYSTTIQKQITFKFHNPHRKIFLIFFSLQMGTHVLFFQGPSLQVCHFKYQSAFGL